MNSQGRKGAVQSAAAAIHRLQVAFLEGGGTSKCCRSLSSCVTRRLSHAFRAIRGRELSPSQRYSPREEAHALPFLILRSCLAALHMCPDDWCPRGEGARNDRRPASSEGGQPAGREEVRAKCCGQRSRPVSEWRCQQEASAEGPLVRNLPDPFQQIRLLPGTSAPAGSEPNPTPEEAGSCGGLRKQRSH